MQDRYIRADRVCKRIRNYFQGILENNVKNVDIVDANADIMKVIDEEPSVMFWQDAELFKPENNKSVFVIVTGKCRTINFENALQIGEWDENEGWIIEGYPELYHPIVKYWCDVPEFPPDVKIK